MTGGRVSRNLKRAPSKDIPNNPKRATGRKQPSLVATMTVAQLQQNMPPEFIPIIVASKSRGEWEAKVRMFVQTICYRYLVLSDESIANLLSML